MRSTCLLAALLLTGSPFAPVQSGNPHRDPTDFQPPINRGEGIIDKNNNTHSLEQADEQRPGEQAVRVDRARIRRDAEELARLAQLTSVEIGNAERGSLPKDLNQNLKRIQKLSKQLREELKP